MRMYELNRGAATPLYEQLYRAIKEDILSGALRGGERLPSKRSLSDALGVSKITVETAYAQLTAEGYLCSRQRSGYYVETLSPSDLPAFKAPIFHREERGETREATPAPASLFPFSVWARLMRGVLLEQSQNLLRPVPSGGLWVLRKAIAELLLRQRGLAVSPRQIVVGAGAEYFYALLIQFLGRERLYALENPGHRKLARVYENCGAAVCPIAMDEAGVLPEPLEYSGAQVLHISPSHHYPTGIVMPISRRQALLRWLEADENRYLIEDDYDAEFRFSGLPIPPLQSLDRTGRLIYMNTFSKTITPALRISYMVLPLGLVERWERVMGFYSCAVPSFEQMTLSRFLSEGYFEKHLSRMKKHYRGIREEMLRVLAASPCARFYSVRDAGAGLHFLLELKVELEQRQLETLLGGVGLEPVFLSSFYLRGAEPNAGRCLVLSYENLEPARLEAALEKLAEKLRASEKL